MLYFDHAATSYPKPAAVLAAMQHWFVDLGVSADRGDSARCQKVGRELDALRQQVGKLVHMPAARVAFLSGATEGLNLALRALLRPGDRVVTTAFEHSSVARPLRALAAERALVLDVLSPDPDGGLDADRVRKALDVPARLLVFSHASNVTGACFDAAAFCECARERDTLTLLDACQTAGLVDLGVGADVVVASGHKALLGPPGTGFVACRPGLDLTPQKQGGTGGSLALDTHPTTWPRAFEAGTPNTPALFGLAAALREPSHSPSPSPSALEHGLQRLDELIEGLRGIAGLRLLTPPTTRRVPILSCVHTGYDTAELGAILDGHGIHARTGFHCAPWLHAHLGTAHGGTLRLSPGSTTTAADVQRVVEVLRAL